MISAIFSSSFWVFYVISMVSVVIVIYNLYRFIVGKDSILPFIFYPKKGKIIYPEEDSDIMPGACLICFVNILYICPFVNTVLYVLGGFLMIVHKLIDIRNTNVRRTEEDARKNNSRHY